MGHRPARSSRSPSEVAAGHARIPLLRRSIGSNSQGWIGGDLAGDRGGTRAKNYSLTRAGRKQLEREAGAGSRLSSARSRLVVQARLKRMARMFRAIDADQLAARSMSSDGRVERELDRELQFHSRRMARRRSRTQAGMGRAGRRAAAAGAVRWNQPDQGSGARDMLDTFGRCGHLGPGCALRRCVCCSGSAGRSRWSRYCRSRWASAPTSAIFCVVNAIVLL